MKTKIKMLMMVLAIAISTNYATAQQQERPKGQQPPLRSEEQIEKMLDHLSRELTLNNKQKENLSELFKAHFNNVKKEMEEEQKQRELHRREMETLRKDFEEKVNMELSEEQQKLFAEFRENHRPPREERIEKPRKK